MKKVAIWLLHAYLMAFPLGFMAIFVVYGAMMTHGEPAAWLLDILLPGVVAVAVAWAMLRMAGRVTRHAEAGRNWARVFVGIEIAVALGVAGYLFSLATTVAAALGVLGLLVAAAGGYALMKRSEA